MSRYPKVPLQDLLAGTPHTQTSKTDGPVLEENKNGYRDAHRRVGVRVRYFRPVPTVESAIVSHICTGDRFYRLSPSRRARVCLGHSQLRSQNRPGYLFLVRIKTSLPLPQSTVGLGRPGVTRHSTPLDDSFLGAPPVVSGRYGCLQYTRGPGSIRTSFE